MQVRLLGPVDVMVDGRSQVVGGLRRTGVLAVLALAAGEVVSADDLTEAVWGGEPPASNSLQSHISGLRGVLGRDAIVARPPGYVLELGADGTDVQAAGRLLRRAAAAAGPAQAVMDLRAALDLWRGTPLTGVAGLPGLAAQAGRLEKLRAQIRRALAEARLAAGEHHQLTGELEQLITAEPLDEQLHALLMLALYRAGRQADALAAYDRIGQALAADLGIDPGPALRDLRAAILRHDPSLTAPAPAVPPVPAMPVPAQLPLGVPGFTGRAAELARLDAFLPPGDRAGTAASPAPAAVVISGTPGVGKTALAVHWAHRAAPRFPGGQLHADLRGFDPAGTTVSPEDALYGFLLALGVPPDRVPADLEARTALYRSRLAGQRIGTYAWQLARDLTAFLVRRGRWDDNEQAQGIALEAARRTGDLAGEAYALYGRAVGYAWSGRTGAAGPLFGQALRRFESTGDHLGQARSHSSLGWLAGNARSLDEAVYHAEQAIGLYRAAGYLPGEARCLNDLGWYYALRGDYRQALTFCEQSLEALRETGERGGEATTLDSLGYIHHQLGDHDSSIAYYRQAIGILRDLGDRLDEADTLSRLGDVLHGSGDTGAARRAWLDALNIYDEIDHPDADELRAKLQPPGHTSAG